MGNVTNTTGWPEMPSQISSPGEFLFGYQNQILGGAYGPGILFLWFTVAMLVSMQVASVKESFGAASFTTFLIATVMSPLVYNDLQLISNYVWIVALMLMVIGVVWNRPQSGRGGGVV